MVVTSSNSVLLKLDKLILIVGEVTSFSSAVTVYMIPVLTRRSLLVDAKKFHPVLFGPFTELLAFQVAPPVAVESLMNMY